MNTLIIGASNKPQRYAYKALHLLQSNGHKVYALAKREMEISGVKVYNDMRLFKDIHTITLYISAKFQPEYYDYILELKPNRVIFNPGTENPEFYSILDKNGINYEIACTLVMLHTKQY